ncbi:DNA double-strand break repair nuclease NurA [Pyxidicoccus sp. 3LFB2]
MPYDGEFAGYRSLQRIAKTERVQKLLGKARVYVSTSEPRSIPPVAPAPPSRLPDFVVAIDGSLAEVDVATGYPGAKVGYCTVASILLDLGLMDVLDEQRPADPREFRKTEESATIDAAFPGSNVVTRTHTTAKDSFRETLYDVFFEEVPDVQDGQSLLTTYEALLALKPSVREGTACPYSHYGCEQHLERIQPGTTSCPCSFKRPIYSTDALRVHERFNDLGSNLEAIGEVMQVWERVLLVHLLRCFERKGWLDREDRIGRLAFIVDGPLAVFGHPAWISTAITRELKRLNAKYRSSTGQDLMILGVEKTGEFVAHFEDIDQRENPGEVHFPKRAYQLLTDQYIKTRVKFSDSTKRYGADTYFGRKLFYKTASGARIVATIPFLTDEQDTLDSDDVALYPQFAATCALLDKLVSSRFPNSLAPLVSANAQAAIPLNLGAKVLEQLARALMKKG